MADVLRVPVLIEGVRLRLRRSTPADAEAIYAMATDADVMRYMEWPMPRALAETRDHLQGYAARWQAGTEHHWMIERKPQGPAIGSIACRIKGHAADFGYFLAREHWGHGLAAEAALLLLGWLQRQGSIVRIWATTDADNTRSAAVLRKAGLQQEGLLRKATVRPQLGPEPRDAVLFAWVAPDVRSDVRSDVGSKNETTP